MDILLAAGAVVVSIGVVCGRLYSFTALLIVSPLLALVGYVGANVRGWSTLAAFGVGAASVVLLQSSYLIGARLRLRAAEHQATLASRFHEKSQTTVPRDAGRPNS